MGLKLFDRLPPLCRSPLLTTDSKTKGAPAWLCCCQLGDIASQSELQLAAAALHRPRCPTASSEKRRWEWRRLLRQLAGYLSHPLPCTFDACLRSIEITQSNVVLRGEGVDKTVLFLPKPLQAVYGNQMIGASSAWSYTGGFLMWVGLGRGLFCGVW